MPAGSCATPLGALEIVKKFGDRAPLGAVFKDRRTTGEIIADLQKQFTSADPAKIRDDISLFLEQLQKKRIVDY